MDLPGGHFQNVEYVLIFAYISVLLQCARYISAIAPYGYIRDSTIDAAVAAV